LSKKTFKKIGIRDWYYRKYRSSSPGVARAEDRPRRTQVLLAAYYLLGPTSEEVEKRPFEK
jgi:hypothetical protein